MIYGILSDIHGNLEALLSVFPYIKKVDKIVVLGDIVGYGPQPNECIEEIMRLKPITVVGNHDLAAVGKKDKRWFNPFARKAIEWTEENLSRENKLWLASLPKIVKEEKSVFVHGSLREYTDEYIFDEQMADANLSFLDGETLFVGHTHSPQIFIKTERGVMNRRILDRENVLLSNTKSIVNPGSIGQPRDYNPKASFGLFNTKTREFLLLRIPYNIQKTQKLMREKGLSEYLIQRLSEGR